MILKKIPIFVVALFLNACAGLVGDRIPDEYIASPEKAAFLVGSIGIKTTGENESPHNHSTIYFRQIGNKKKASIVVSQSLYFPDKVDYRGPDRKGTVFALALEPGEYEFVDVSFYYNTGTLEKSYSAKEDFSLPFTIEAGRVYYMGEFLSHGRYGENIFGITVLAGGYFTHRMNRQRDLPLLLAKYPELQGREVVRADVELNLPPFIYPSEL